MTDKGKYPMRQKPTDNRDLMTKKTWWRRKLDNDKDLMNPDDIIQKRINDNMI